MAKSDYLEASDLNFSTQLNDSLAADSTPAPPVLPPAVVAVGCGIETRFGKLPHAARAG